LRYYRLMSTDGGHRLAVEVQDGTLADLTSIDDDLTGVNDLALTASLSGASIDDVARNILSKGYEVEYDLEDVVTDSRNGAGGRVAGQAARPARGMGGRRNLQDERDGSGGARARRRTSTRGSTRQSGRSSFSRPHRTGA